jgi:hypothetical protein
MIKVSTDEHAVLKSLTTYTLIDGNKDRHTEMWHSYYTASGFLISF